MKSLCCCFAAAAKPEERPAPGAPKQKPLERSTPVEPKSRPVSQDDDGGGPKVFATTSCTTPHKDGASTPHTIATHPSRYEVAVFSPDGSSLRPLSRCRLSHHSSAEQPLTPRSTRQASRLSVAYAPDQLNSPRDEQTGLSSGALSATLGNATRHGLSPGRNGKGIAKINQDRGVVHHPFNGSQNEALFCVFDGHGSGGEKVAEYCMRKIPTALQEKGDLRASTEATLEKAVCDVDRSVLRKAEGRFALMCGCTSIIVYLQGRTLWTACSGDSRAVLGYSSKGSIRARDLSEDCKPDDPKEKKRIEKCGGVVTGGGRPGVPARVWANGAVGLAMSRSIGDGEVKKFGVICDPKIRKFEITPAPANDNKADGDRFIIVASDGVWEFIDSQEACDIVASELLSGAVNASQACMKLVQMAAAWWKQEEGNYRDDITAIVARLPFVVGDGEETPPKLDVGISGGGSSLYINMGEEGLSSLAEGEESPVTPTRMPKKDEGEEDGDDFRRKRLSVADAPSERDSAEQSDWSDKE